MTFTNLTRESLTQLFFTKPKNMKDFLQITFSSFWHFIGVMMLLALVGNFILGLFKVILWRNTPEKKKPNSSIEDLL